jgi:uncharacterized protein
VSVEDADAAAGRAEALGATVVLPAGDVGDSGRLAVFQDPQGASLSVWHPGRHFGAGLVKVPGALTWNDLLTPEVEASAVARAGALGGQVVMGPMEVPSGRFAIIRDPHNAVFSVVDGEFDP